MRKVFCALLLCSLSVGCSHGGRGGADGRLTDPLPSWVDGATKSAILAYIKQVTDSSGPQFIPAADRIATFDNDGTLWAEKPYVQEVFALWQAKRMMAADPHLKQLQPFKAVAEGDKMYFIKGGDKALIQLVAATHTGMTEDSFEQTLNEFFRQAKVGERPISRLVYQPQLELLNLLRASRFKVYICTGGTIEVVRGISEQLYGVPKEQVIGTSFKYKFNDSTRTLQRLPELDHFNDKEGKPVGIQLHIGKRPVFACGNEGGAGDIAMLKFTQGNHYPTFQLIINHDDSSREFFYQEKDNATLHAAVEGRWKVVSMKNDWKKIFPDK